MVGSPNAELRARVMACSPAALLALSEARLDVTGEAALVTWLNQHVGALGS